MEIRSISSNLSSDGGKLVGYAAVFNSPSQVLSERGRKFVETISPTAFNRSLNQGSDVTAHYSHNEDARPPLGRTSAGTLRLNTDERGLAFEIDLPTWASDIKEAVHRGDVKAMSFKFATVKDSWQQRDGLPHRTVHDLDLMHIALVNEPAYSSTSVAVRTKVEPPDTFMVRHEAELNYMLRKM
jgi:hypothetical protein